MNKKIALLLLTTAALYSCRKPKPLNIDIPQQKDQPVVASTMPDDRTLLISAGYSLDAITNMEDSTSNSRIPKSMLIDSGMVSISEAGGAAHNLVKVSAGMYATRDLTLKEGSTYTLQIADYRKGVTATATTTYMPQPTRGQVAPAYVGERNGDTLFKLKVTIPDAQQGGHYFMSYTTTRQVRQNVKLLTQSPSQNTAALSGFEAKQLEMIESNTTGELTKEYTLNLSPKDTLIVQVARIDAGYFKYLQTYKRTGYLINQLTGEPINLPTNIQTGYGYFAIYKPHRYVFALSKHISN